VPQWGFFVGFAALITVLVLALARTSQRAIDTAGSGPTPGATDVSHGTASWRVVPDDRLGEPVPESPDGKRAPGGPEHPPDGPGVSVPGPGAPAKQGDASGKRGQPLRDVELTANVLLANVAVTQGLVAGLLVAAAWFSDIPARAFGVTAEPLSSGPLAVAVGLAFGTVLWTGNELSTTLADVVGAAYDERVRRLLAPESAAGWLVLLGGVLPIIAVSEELLFRAALVGVPAAGFGVSPWLLAVVSSLAFALGHGAQGRAGVVVTGLLGFVLAAGYVLTDSLLLVVVAHYAVNVLEFLVHESPLARVVGRYM